MNEMNSHISINIRSINNRLRKVSATIQWDLFKKYEQLYSLFMKVTKDLKLKIEFNYYIFYCISVNKCIFKNYTLEYYNNFIYLSQKNSQNLKFRKHTIFLI